MESVTTDQPGTGPVADDPAVVVIGGGPAGLFAAEQLSRASIPVVVFDRMPTFGRKLQMAGRGGLNLTHSEPLDAFLDRYGTARTVLGPAIDAFPPTALRDWAAGLGQETFIGSSGRVFPTAMKAAPLLRAWLARLQGQGVRFRYRCDWVGWNSSGSLLFRDADGAEEAVNPRATVLALGGASWPRLGSNGAWTDILRERGVEIVPLRPANSGFEVHWSELFRERFQGHPLKNVELHGAGQTVRGDAMVTAYGVEGGAIYALSAALRDRIAAEGKAVLHVNFRPDRSREDLERRLGKPRGKQSQSDFLRRALGLPPIAINLMREAVGPALPTDPAALSALVQAVPIELTATRPLERAISSAGGIAFDALDDNYMLKCMPGVFAAGEMLDWEAPTGGYLLQGVFASGMAAAQGVRSWLESDRPAHPRKADR